MNIFESTPVYPIPSRYWQSVAKCKFFSVLTAFHLFRQLGECHVENHDLSSLLVLTSVGEPVA